MTLDAGRPALPDPVAPGLARSTGPSAASATTTLQPSRPTRPSTPYPVSPSACSRAGAGPTPPGKRPSEARARPPLDVAQARTFDPPASRSLVALLLLFT